MRHLLFFLIAFSMVAWNAGCAQTEVPDSPSKTVPVACKNSVTEDTSILDWELTVMALPIESGEPFAATLDGAALFSETFFDSAQTALPGGAKELNLIEVKTTVHVRSGATGDDVVLTIDPDPYEYQCFFGRAECDPANDLPSVPGRRGNADCEPQADTNPCGRFVPIPTSTNCAPGGVCADLHKTGPGSQCSDNEFCVTGGLRLELERALSEYVADSQGKVLFGWAEGSTGEMPMDTDPIGPIGLRVGVGPLVVALECVMPASTPDSELISLPIETP